MTRLKAVMVVGVAPLALMCVSAFAAEAPKAACEKLAATKIASTAVKSTFLTTPQELDAAFQNPDSRATAPGASSPALAALPFCRVEVTITPAAGADIKSELWLPAAEKWNKRYVAVGAGGSAGTIDRGALAGGVAAGYAVATSDAGSHSTELLSMSFGRNPEWAANRAYRGVHLTAVAAKQLVQNYYQGAPRASLFMGCSGGGYEAMSLLQRYPDDYDGVLAGDPALHWEKIGLWQGMAYVATHRDPSANISAAKLMTINKAALKSCDALDGVTDGVIDDPRKCKVDFKALQCKGAETDECFTPAQAEALTTIYAPFVHPRTKEYLFPGFTYGAETAQAARARLAGEALGSTISAGHPGPLVWTLPENFTAKDWLTFDFDKGADSAIKAFAPYSNSDPDLSKFKQKGGKVIMYSGWADPNLNPETLVNYYEQMKKKLGGDAAVNAFSRLFMAPGMNHCSGGPGPNIFGQPLANAFDTKTDAGNNILLALDRWVVDGVAPEQVTALKYVDNDKTKGVQRTRPLCAYPKVAKWSGTGSTDDAKNFSCVVPQD